MKDVNRDEWAVISENISLMVKSSHKTKSQIAKEVGIKSPTLSQYLSKRAYPSLVTLKRLCKVLDCEYEEILGSLDGFQI